MSCTMCVILDSDTSPGDASAATGGRFDGLKQVLYWADVTSEVAFVVPSPKTYCPRVRRLSATTGKTFAFVASSKFVSCSFPSPYLFSSCSSFPYLLLSLPSSCFSTLLSIMVAHSNNYVCTAYVLCTEYSKIKSFFYFLWY